MDLEGFARRDRSRRALGALLAEWGWGPLEASFRVALDEPGLRLRDYGGSGPVLLLVPAPIKRAYIWDLAPSCSVVRRALDAGCRVYLIEWREPIDQGWGLADYAERMILACLDAIAEETGERGAFLAGHSLGGTLAAVFSALHAERVRGLVLLAAPLHFAPDAGVLSVLLADLPVERLPAGPVPGSFLNAVGLAAAPATFGLAPWLDWWASLPDADARDTLLRVQRWTLDELPLPGRLLAEVVDRLYREDAFARGALSLGGRRAAPAEVTAPLLCVVDRRCPLVPPAAMLPVLRGAGSPEKMLLYYEGDAGVLLQHVGMLVGRSAHQRLWPEILRWIRAAPARD